MTARLRNNPDSAQTYSGIYAGIKMAKLWYGRSVHCVLLGLIVLPASALDLFPNSLKERRGSNGGQPLSVLTVQDQSATQDHWDRYLEVHPADNGYRGDFFFSLPGDFDADDIESLAISANYRGEERAEQRWRWQLRDFAAKRWVTLGDNGTVTGWVWSSQRFAVPGNAQDYVNSSGKLKLRYLTQRTLEASHLDYLALHVEIDGQDPTPPPSSVGVWRPAPGTSWQWQLTGTIDTNHDVTMYDIDLFDASQSVIDALHDAGRAVVCYFSAGSWEKWRPDAAQFSSLVKGRGNGWPGERWLDIRRIDLLAPILRARLDLAQSKGCDGVEPDNIDGYANKTGFPLSGADQLTYNRWLADEAHARGMSIGLKNDLDQVEELEPWFDWALNEQCFQYRECELLTPFIHAGKAVFGVEYSGDPASYCPKANAMDLDWLVKDWSLGSERLSCREAF